MSALRIGIAILVTIVWAVVYLAAVFSHRYTAPPELSAVMLAVVTWLFGTEIRKQVHRQAEKVADATEDHEKPAAHPR